MKVDNSLQKRDSVYWPLHDMYFSLGVCSVINDLKKFGIREEFYFMKVEPELLISFLSELNEILKTNNKVILISNRSLLPLSLFLLEEKNSVYTVIESSIKVDEIVKHLIKGIRKPLISNKPKEVINHQDLMILEDFIKNEKIHSLKSKYKCSISTIYYKRKVVSRKFMTDKIHKIFIK